MPIPKNITREHLLQAIYKIDKEGIPNDSNSKYYDIIHNGKTYPPKLVVSYANVFANGVPLDRNSFSGGLNEPSFKLLQQNNFKIIPKESNNIEPYFIELKKFLSQANTNQLVVKEYKNEYLGLKVKVSFGQGNPARIPWIAFLNTEDTVSDGIYPVYLYYKEKQLLILAYGISETRAPSREWNVSNKTTITQYFLENNLGLPERYGSSFVKNIYYTYNELDPQSIQEDLNEIITEYKKIDPIIRINNTQTMNINFSFKEFHAKTLEAGLKFSEKIVCRFIASLCTKPFVICSGLSGSGKTKLAQSFVHWICESNEQYKIIPVGADWTNREPLLGFPNGLDKESYIHPDSGALQLILNALNPKNTNRPYFLILDEMNLSHVERYFADFLSIMESQDKIKLYSGEKRDNLQNEIFWPQNLFIIGTVNIDETTYMFSPKVLDRANVIEFRITETEIEDYLANPVSLEMDKLINQQNKQGYGAPMAANYLKIAKGNEISNINTKEILLLFFKELRKAGAEFGYRSAAEINRLIAILDTLTKESKEWDGVTIDKEEFIDIAIMQKLLPKLHGSRNKLTKVLPILGGLCLTDSDTKNIKENYFDKPDSINFSGDKNIKYKLSFEKICRMYKNAIENGFASYAEA